MLESQFGGDASDIGDRLASERTALEEAISRVEATFADRPGTEAGPAADGSTPPDDLPPPPRPVPAPSQAAGGAHEAPVAARATTAPRRKARGLILSALVAGFLGVSLLGAGVVAWRAVLHRGRAVTPADTEADDSGRAGTGAAVPPPVGEASLAGSEAGITVQRAALLVDAPQDPQRLKTYVGTVDWRLARPAPGSGAAEIRAAIQIPEAGLKVDVSFARNVAPQLPASHTVEISFRPQPGSPLGAIDQVDLPEMRDDNAPTGARLSGLQAKIADGHYLFGLSRGAAEAQNLQLMQTRPWIDVPVLLSGHRVAKLTFEKGATGDAVWSQALGDWTQTAGGARMAVDGPKR